MKTISARKDIKELILDAAEHLLAMKGYQKMTMEDIANQVDIGKGTTYLHYTSKEDLVLAHIDRIIYRLQGKLFAVAHSSKSYEEKIIKMLSTRVLFRFDSVQNYTECLNDLLAVIRPSLLARRHEYFKKEARIFSEVLRDAENAGELFMDDSFATAETLLTATNALLPYDLSINQLGSRKEIEQKVLAVARLLVKGLQCANKIPVNKKRSIKSKETAQ